MVFGLEATVPGREATVPGPEATVPWLKATLPGLEATWLLLTFREWLFFWLARGGLLLKFAEDIEVVEAAALNIRASSSWRTLADAKTDLIPGGQWGCSGGQTRDTCFTCRNAPPNFAAEISRALLNR